MVELLRILVTYQRIIYGVLGVLVLIYLKKVISAWSERHSTIFGLERESAQRQLNQSLTILIILLLLLGSEFVITTFVVPEYPLVIPAPTEAAPAAEDGGMMIQNPNDSGSQSSSLEILTEGTPQETNETTMVFNSETVASGCKEGELEWIEPEYAEEMSGNYALKATVNVQNLGFFNYAYSQLGDQQTWTIISGGSTPVVEEVLGLWATSQVPDGDYVLRLTVYDLVNNELPPCDVTVRVSNNE